MAGDSTSTTVAATSDERSGSSRGASAKKARPRPAIFRALGRREPPSLIAVGGRDGPRFALKDVLKHDSWAATAVYIAAAPGDTRKVIAKFNREQAIVVVPMGWLGRRLARRETRYLTMLADVPHVPRDCGLVFDASSDEAVTSTPLPNCSAHWYIDGHPLGRHERVNDEFFARLGQTLAAVHARGIAYIDLHKRENIIVAEDGSPVLIDFQICQSLPRGVMGRVFPIPQIIRTFQQMDEYHLLKHTLRLRPDLVPPERRDLNKARPGFVRFCRAVGDPLRWTRRKILTLTGVRGKSGSVTSEAAPEDAFRAGEH